MATAARTTDSTRRRGPKLPLLRRRRALPRFLGMAVADYMRRNHPNVRVLLFAVPDQFIEHGNPEKLKEKLGLDPVSIFEKIKEAR